MNGISLLVALAALGVDAGWETGPGGQLVYTIHLEQLLLEPLREGQAVVSSVDVKDRGLRRFQILMDGKKTGAETAARRNDTLQGRSPQPTMVKFGWQVGEDGGLEYLVQIMPERLETLASGVPVIGEVDPSLPEIHRFYVYVGVGEPRRSALENKAPIGREAPPFLAVDNPSLPGAESSTRPSIGIGTQTPGGYQRLAGDSRNSASFDQNQGYQPLRDNGWQTDAASSPPAGYARTRNDRSAIDGRVADGRSPEFNVGFPSQNPSGSTTGGVPYRDEYPSREPQAPADPGSRGTANPLQPGYAQRPVSPPQPQPENTAAVAPASAPQNGWQTGAPNQQPASTWDPSTAATSVDREDPVRPWTPLILTAFALFTSLGVNAFLSWVAWSFFWRYHDAANDLSRSRSFSAGSRQAA